MKLLRIQRINEDTETVVGVVHVAWEDDGEEYWPACGTMGRPTQYVKMFVAADGPTTCRNCRRLRVSHFRRVRNRILEWQEGL